MKKKSTLLLGGLCTAAVLFAAEVPQELAPFADWRINEPPALAKELRSRCIKIEGTAVSIRAHERNEVHFTSDKLIAVKSGDKVHISFTVSGKGVIQAGFYAKANRDGEGVSAGHLAKLIALKPDQTQEQSITTTVTNAQVKFINPFIGVGKNGSATFSNYNITLITK